jgi:D-alanyl-lipoteichoic acid acyltransferase DltB (MBOAT superfamily)
VAFAFQIYCDFSAYSDIAVGTAKLFGVRLRRNFAYPYFSQSISEFWRRWHISLSTWFRDYLFIPLGGSRGPLLITVRNLFLTALVSGLWHGAAWHFVAWGGLHGLYLAAERSLRRTSARRTAASVPGGESALPRPAVLLRMLLVFCLVCAAWVLFRASSLADALCIYRKVLCEAGTTAFYTTLWTLVLQHWSVLACLPGLVLVEWLGRRNWHPLAIARAPLLLRWGVYSLLFWGILCLGTRRTEDFIYFRF